MGATFTHANAAGTEDLRLIVDGALAGDACT
jgi:hypothetical protein